MPINIDIMNTTIKTTALDAFAPAQLRAEFASTLCSPSKQNAPEGAKAPPHTAHIDWTVTDTAIVRAARRARNRSVVVILFSNAWSAGRN